MSLETRIRVISRFMIRRDMREVLEIEDAGFDHPWCEEEFLRVLRHRHCLGMVAEHRNRVVGFMVYRVLTDRVQLLDFAVHPDYRRRGVGRHLSAKLVDKALYHKRNRIAMTVRETNLAAQLFFRRQGFRAVETLAGHYRGTGEDGYLMEYRLDDSAVHEGAKDRDCEGC